MTRYFIFLVIHTFLIVTLASGIISSIKPIAENPTSVATILATQLPMASTFFLTYIFLAFAGLAGSLLQVIPLALYYVKIILLGGTPRSMYSSKYSLRTPDWGTMFPSASIVAVIGRSDVASELTRSLVIFDHLSRYQRFRHGLLCIRLLCLVSIWSNVADKQEISLHLGHGPAC
jgi:hypothetical protein